MNRIQQLATAPSIAADNVTESSKCVDIGLRGEAVCHALFGPLHYESAYGYPLVVWLHGPEGDEQQLRRIMPLVSMRNYVAVAPRGTVAADAETGQGGYRWRQSDDHILLAEQRVFECIELAKHRFNVAPSRIFLAGYAEGGTMAYRVALNHPRRFAGVMSLGGAFPAGDCPLRYLNEARRLPLLLSTGRDSTCYSEAMVCHDLRLLHSAGMSVTLRQYPCGDELAGNMLSDIDGWLMEQICPTDPVDRDATGQRADR